MKITRRGFLISGAAIGGGLVLGISLWPEPPLKLTAKDGETIINGWVKIDRDGIIRVVVPQAEMGQGITTGLPMILAEELDANFDDVRFEQAPVDGFYVNDLIFTEGLEDNDSVPGFIKPFALWAGGKAAELFSMQLTGGSTSVRNFYQPMRQAGAMARSVLVEAAARKLAVPINQLKTENSFVIHSATGQKLSYAELVDDAAKIKPNDDIPLKNPDSFKIIGKSAPRIDVPEKVTGEAKFGMDIRLPNMVYAAIKAVPAAGGKVDGIVKVSNDNDRGIIKTISGDDFVSVVATNYWYAKKRLENIDIGISGTPAVSSDELEKKYNNDLASKEGHIHREEGDLALLEQQEGSWYEARYDVPFLAHSCLEPMNCTVDINADGCDIYMPTQAAGIARSIAADILGMDKEKVRIHTTFLGGGFGRKIETDCMEQAVKIAMKLDTPVQLIWDREEDTRHDIYRPKFKIDMAAYLGADGKVLGLKTKGTSQSVDDSFGSRMFVTEPSEEPAADPSSVEGIDNTPYEFPNIWVNHVAQKQVIPVGFWRSVGHSNNAYFMESFMDELGTQLGQDPFAVRRQLLANNKRALKVLDKLEAVSNWSGANASEYGKQKRARGMALHYSFATWVGIVVDVLVDDGAVKVEKVTLVADCGQVINPDNVRSQMESGFIYGLTAALYGDINLENGEVVESNFHDYEAVKIANSPEFDVHIIADGDKIGGVGEPSTPPAAPAVINAIFAATGERIRSLPIKNSSFDIF